MLVNRGPQTSFPRDRVLYVVGSLEAPKRAELNPFVHVLPQQDTVHEGGQFPGLVVIVSPSKTVEAFC